VGKLGSIAGPFLGGVILSTSLPTRNVFAMMAVWPALELVCLLVIGRTHSGMLTRERQQTIDHRASHGKHIRLR
jgi:MFS-type transporter involved in bile tolerance (Atg22 family)